MLYTAVVLQLKLFAARWHFNLATFLNSSPAQVLCTKLANLRQLSQYIRHNYYFSKKHNRYNMKLDPGYYLLFFFPVQLKPTKLWDKGDNEISRYFWRRKCNIVEIFAKYFVDTFTRLTTHWGRWWRWWACCQWTWCGSTWWRAADPPSCTARGPSWTGARPRRRRGCHDPRGLRDPHGLHGRREHRVRCAPRGRAGRRGTGPL